MAFHFVTAGNKGKAWVPSIQTKDFSLQSEFLNVDIAAFQEAWPLYPSDRTEEQIELDLPSQPFRAVWGSTQHLAGFPCGGLSACLLSSVNHMESPSAFFIASPCFWEVLWFHRQHLRPRTNDLIPSSSTATKQLCDLRQVSWLLWVSLSASVRTRALNQSYSMFSMTSSRSKEGQIKIWVNAVSRHFHQVAKGHHIFLCSGLYSSGFEIDQVECNLMVHICTAKIRAPKASTGDKMMINGN